MPPDRVGLLRNNELTVKNEEKMAYLAVDEFDVAGTLGVAITSSILGTGFVVREFRHATVRIHL